MTAGSLGRGQREHFARVIVLPAGDGSPSRYNRDSQMQHRDAGETSMVCAYPVKSVQSLSALFPHGRETGISQDAFQLKVVKPCYYVSSNKHNLRKIHFVSITVTLFFLTHYLKTYEMRSLDIWTTLT